MSIAKKIACLFLVLALCLSIGGCGKKKKQIVIIKRPSSQVSDTVDDTNDDINSEDTNSEEDETDSKEAGTDSEESETDSEDVGTNSEDDETDSEEAETDSKEDEEEADEEEYEEEIYESYRELADKEVTGETDREKEYTVKPVTFKLTDEYTVVYPEGNVQLKQAAKKLVTYLSENGIKLSLASDTSAVKEREILIGDTNRLKSNLAENKYAVSVVKEKLFFESGNFNGVVKAVSWFISFDFEKGKINTLTGEYEFVASIKRADGTYNFVWGDEFDGNALDTNKWDFSSSISAESSFKLSRDPAAINVSDGLLKMSAMRWFDPDNNQIQAIAPYTVEGKKFMNYQYGYLEMKARIPFGNGAWPSLWLSGSCRDGAVVSSLFNRGDIIPSNFSAEIDIIEYTTLQPNMHKWFYDDDSILELIKDLKLVDNKHSSYGGAINANNGQMTKSDLGLDPQQNYIYQTVGYEWTPNDMTIYLNGEKYFYYNWKESIQLDELNDMSDFLNPVFIRLNNHLLPKNIPSDFSTLPCEFFVEYVRLYQKPNTGGIWLAE